MISLPSHWSWEVGVRWDFGWSNKKHAQARKRHSNTQGEKIRDHSGRLVNNPHTDKAAHQPACTQETKRVRGFAGRVWGTTPSQVGGDVWRRQALGKRSRPRARVAGGRQTRRGCRHRFSQTRKSVASAGCTEWSTNVNETGEDGERVCYTAEDQE